MKDNLFSTEADVVQFLRSRQDGLTSDYGINSLVTFPYATTDARVLACAAITAYLARWVGTRGTWATNWASYPILRVTAFLEVAGYVPAIETLMRLRNRLEAELGECGPGTYGHEMVVAVRNAVATLQLARNAPTEAPNSQRTSADRDSLVKALERAVESLETRLADAADHLRKALEYVHSDPGASLVKTRQVFEKLLITAYSRRRPPPRRSAINDILCDAQFTQGLDRRILARMRHLQ